MNWWLVVSIYFALYFIFTFLFICLKNISFYVLFPGHNHLLTTGTDDLTLHHCWGPVGEVSSVQVVMTWNINFLEVASMVVTWWLVAFLPNTNSMISLGITCWLIGQFVDYLPVLYTITSYYNSSSVCLFVSLFVPLLLRGPLTDLCQTWWVCVGGPRNCTWGVLFWKGQRVNGSTGQTSLFRSRRHQAETTPLQKAHSVFCRARRLLPSKRHTASKSNSLNGYIY